MEKVKISDCCTITNGFAFKSDKYVQNNGARVIRITNVQKGKIVDNDPKLYPFELLKDLNTYKIFEGDILMSLTGNVGRVGKFPQEMIPAYINQRICRIMPKDERLDINYLFQFLNNDIFEREAIHNSSGAAQLNLSTRWLNNYEIPLPTLSTQKTIAAKLDKAQEIIAYNQQLLEKYDQLTQALFIDMFGDPVKNEKGWEKDVLGNHCVKIQIGPFGSQLHLSDYVNEGIPLINPTNIKKGFINYESSVKITREKFESLPNYHLKTNDIIMSRRGDLSNIGIVDKEGTFCGTGSLYLRLKKSLQPIFCYYLLGQKSTINSLYEKAQGITMPNLNKQIIFNLEVSIPDENLQNQFAERIEKIEVQKQMSQDSLAKSEELFQSLLKESFS
ncbi:MAG: hypothetical protein ABS44_05165 [Chryseobacterium sp. SCN 40-13]|nr:MAG: hypothetical protein ABS44_05165 [Chryseobacterium sp. SCN 40-13]